MLICSHVTSMSSKKQFVTCLPITYITIIRNTENKQGYYYYYYNGYYFYYIAGIIIVNFNDHKRGQTLKRIVKTFYLFLILYIVVCK